MIAAIHGIVEQQSYLGYALFDGVDDYINIPKVNIPTGNFEIYAEINIPNVTGRKFIYSNEHHTGSNLGITRLEINGNKFVTAIRNSTNTGSAAITGTTIISPNTWYAVSFKRVGETITLSVGGVQEGSASYASTNNITSGAAQARIGNISTDTPDYTLSFKGYMREVKVISGTATLEEYYKLNKDAQDSSGNNRHGTPVNGVTF